MPPKRIATLTVIILLVVGGGFFWHATHHEIKEVRTNQGKAIAKPNVPGKEDNTNNPTTGAGASKDAESNESGPAPSPAIQPSAPTGQYISNHRPSLSSPSGANTETSTCTTTPGVQCQIRFTSGSTVKFLPAQKTDGNGNTIWSNWTLQSVGLTVGTWKVSAVAINGTKTAVTHEATPPEFVVSQ